jgi:hypothetical protein
MIDTSQVLGALTLGWELRWSVLMAAALGLFPWWTTRPLRLFTGNVLELGNPRSAVLFAAINVVATCALVASAWLSMRLCGAEGWVVLPVCGALALAGAPAPFAALLRVVGRERQAWSMRAALLAGAAAAPAAGLSLAWVLTGEPGPAASPGTLGAAHVALAGLWLAMLTATLVTATLFGPRRTPQGRQVAAGVWLLALVALGVVFLPGAAYWVGHLGWLEVLLGRAGVPAEGVGELEPPVELLFLGAAFLWFSMFSKRHRPTLKGEPAPPTTDWSAHRTALEKRLGANRLAIVVSTQGGGIQSAAWTTRVLHGLSEQLPGFFDRVVLMSGTSGGAVGLAWVMASCAEGSPERGLVRAAGAARIGSLDALGWGTVYLDGLGAAWERSRGRGWALEEDWRSIARERGIPVLSMRSLREPIARGDLPIPVLNATVLESGTPLTLCPLAFPPLDAEGPVPSDWWQAAVGDVDWFCAARLASSFAYSTPMVYVPGPSPFHLADGGYFDNTGAYSALRWLDAMQPTLTRVDKVVWVEITPFEPPPRRRAAGRFAAALLAPLVLLYRVRFGGPLIVRPPPAVQLLANDAGADRIDGRVQRLTVAFRRQGKTPEPLSWQLSTAQHAAIDQAWDQWWAAHGAEARRLLT